MAMQQRLKEASAWGERLSALINEAEGSEVDLRMVRSILKDAISSVNEEIANRVRSRKVTKGISIKPVK